MLAVGRRPPAAPHQLGRSYFFFAFFALAFFFFAGIR